MTILDRYLLSQTVRLLLISTGIVFLPLILERLLRLFEFATEKNVGIGVVLQMAVNLVPHYLGLALPAAFFVSVLLTISRMGDENEFDVIRATGQPIRRTARPIILLGFALSIFAVLLMGYIQPFSRYAYGAIRHAASHAIWSKGISPSQFYIPSRNLTIYAEEINLQGRGLSGIFIHETDNYGAETTVSARDGYVETDPNTKKSSVFLSEATIINSGQDRAPIIVNVGSVIFQPDVPFQPPAFRARGKAERELTLGEIWERQREELSGDTPVDRETIAQLSAEANGRLIRSISIAAMPFLAIPMGISAKRRNQGMAIAIGSVFLVAYHYTLEMGQGLVAIGSISPLIGMWTPLAIFVTFSLYLFYRAEQKPRSHALEGAIEKASDAVGAALKKVGLAKLVFK